MIRRLPILSSMAWIPHAYIDVQSWKDYLTITLNDASMGGVPNEEWIENNSDEEPEKIIELFDDSKPGYLGLPRQLGLENFPHLNFVNRTAKGHTIPGALKGLKRIKPRDRKQQEFFDMLADVCKRTPVDFVANAMTGSGKTVADLKLSIDLGITTLVVVPTNRLKDQWVGNIKKKHGMRFLFGDKFVDKYVGIVQQDVCDYKGKLIVVAMLPSLARRDYGRKFYRYFGKITFDEVDVCSAPFMSNVLRQFPASIRGGYTATNRTDTLKVVTNWHLGKPKVKSKQTVMAPRVFVYTRRERRNLRHNSVYDLITSVSQIKERNQLLANLIYTRAHLRGRVVVILSDRTKQLQHLQVLLLKKGIPRKLMGLYVGEYYTGKKRVNRNGKKVDEKIKVAKNDLDRMGDECTIFLATYGIFGRGNDIARIDMGIEATPRGKMTQPIGRITRPLEGKPTPEWYSIDDVIYSASKNELYEELIDMQSGREWSYRQQKAEVKRING